MAIIVFNGVDASDPPIFNLTISEGTAVNLFMIATVEYADFEFGSYGPPVTTVVSFDTPDGLPPVDGGDSQTYINPSAEIPALSYSWVIDNVEYSADSKSDVPDQIDWLTSCLPNPVSSKTFSITVSAESTDNIGNTISASQTYEITLRNGWDNDKAELVELLLRQTKV